MFILKHGLKEDKPFVKSVTIGVTGIDISFSNDEKALRFASRGASIQVGNALRNSFGNFYPVEVKE